jgi:hypothetical protein
MPTMIVDDPRQKIALTGIVSALFFSASYIYICALYFPFHIPPMESTADKIIFAWQNTLFAAMPLAGGLFAVMIRKLLRPQSLDGEPVLDGSRLDIHIRFVRDTAHNLIIFVVMLFNLSFYLEGEFLRIIPSVTSWFIFARLYYWGAYLISPPQRIFGTMATLAPVIFFMLVAAVHILGWI